MDTVMSWETRYALLRNHNEMLYRTCVDRASLLACKYELSSQVAAAIEEKLIDTAIEALRLKERRDG